MDDYEGTNPLFPDDVSGDEGKAGFTQTVIPAPGGAYAFEPTRIRVVTRDLGGGKLAIKMKKPTGEITYAVWDGATHRPVDQGTSSLDELRARFPVQ